MLQIFSVTFPFFALVLCGYLAATRRMLPLEAIPGLNGFVLFFALPCMLFRFGAATPIAQLLDGTLVVLYLLCALIVVGLTIAVTLNDRIRWNDASFGALVAAFPNTGFMGVPLLVALLGAQAAGPTILTILLDMVVTTSLCIALSRLDAADQHGMATAARKALSGMLVNPLPWSILLGAAASAVSLKLPGPVDKTIALLAEAASPVALFTIGAVIARSQKLAADKRAAGQPASGSHDYILVALIKLFVHPVLVLAVASGARYLGAPINPFTITVMVLVAALPSASNVSMLAERYGADNGRVARIILVSTVVAFFTFSGAVALMR